MPCPCEIRWELTAPWHCEQPLRGNSKVQTLHRCSLGPTGNKPGERDQDSHPNFACRLPAGNKLLQEMAPWGFRSIAIGLVALVGQTHLDSGRKVMRSRTQCTATSHLSIPPLPHFRCLTYSFRASQFAGTSYNLAPSGLPSAFPPTFKQTTTFQIAASLLPLPQLAFGIDTLTRFGRYRPIVVTYQFASRQLPLRSVTSHAERHPAMPIRNPFARRHVADDESSRPGSAAGSVNGTHPGFERVDTVGSKASSALSIRSSRSQDTEAYKMSGTTSPRWWWVCFQPRQRHIS